MAKNYIVIPTYNEAENISHLIERILALPVKLRVLVVDDHSPDGTADKVRDVDPQGRRVTVQVRPGKRGIGSAILDGMRTCLRDPECSHVVTMDADFSHNPDDIPRMIEAASEADMVQASRYMPGGRIVGWDLKRKIISATANFLYRSLFGLSQREVTTSFRVYSRRCAEVLVQAARSATYVYVAETALILKDHGFHVKEVPITFVSRTAGQSKLSLNEITTSFRFLVRTFLARSLRPSSRRSLVGPD
jgi:dolichol-phosphate mannosyltransferase